MRRFAIVPAAGRSTRMGRPKLLMPWGDGTVIQATLAAWKASAVDEIVVVLHPDDTELAAVIHGELVHAVVADTPPPDMRASLVHGLAWVAAHLAPDDDDVWLAAPADLPDLSAAVIDRLLDAYDPTFDGPLMPVVAGRLGHPILLRWALQDRVAKLPDGDGLNRLVSHDAVRKIPCPEVPLSADIDTPAQYARRQPRR